MTETIAPELEQSVLALLRSDPAALADPFPVWNRLRDTTPVWRMRDAIVLTLHEHVREVLGDYLRIVSRERTRNAAMYQRARTQFHPDEREAFDRTIEHEFRQLVRLDPPDHTRIRDTVRAPFSVRSLAREMEPTIVARVEEGLDELSAKGDVVDFKEFAYTLPFRVIGDLLGISLRDLDVVHNWARTIADNKFNADSGPLAIAAADAYDNLMGYVDDLLSDHRRSGSGTGLVNTLIEATDTGYVTPEEASSLMGLMIFAGHETTSSLLSTGLLELLRRPDQWAVLCDDPEIAPRAVEELVRFVTPAQFLPYTSIVDRELGDEFVREGETIIVSLAAANRDPRIFDRPDELDLLREDNRGHIGFGLGPHFCLGAGLARMEATILFREFARRFPGAALVPEDIRWGGRALRSPLRLPIRLRAGS